MMTPQEVARAVASVLKDYQPTYAGHGESLTQALRQTLDGTAVARAITSEALPLDGASRQALVEVISRVAGAIRDQDHPETDMSPVVAALDGIAAAIAEMPDTAPAISEIVAALNRNTAALRELQDAQLKPRRFTADATGKITGIEVA